MPIRRRRATSRPAGRPNQCTSPPSGRSTDARQPNKVVLPAPLAPVSATDSPAAISKSTASSTIRPPKAFDNRLARIAGWRFAHRHCTRFGSSHYAAVRRQVACRLVAAVRLARSLDCGGTFCVGQNHGTAPATTIPPAKPHPPHHRIVHQGKPDPVLPFAAVQDRVEVAAPGGVDGDFRVPLVLRGSSIPVPAAACMAPPVGGYLQLGLHDQLLGKRRWTRPTKRMSRPAQWMDSPLGSVASCCRVPSDDPATPTARQASPGA